MPTGKQAIVCDAELLIVFFCYQATIEEKSLKLSSNLTDEVKSSDHVRVLFLIDVSIGSIYVRFFFSVAVFHTFHLLSNLYPKIRKDTLEAWGQ